MTSIALVTCNGAPDQDLPLLREAVGAEVVIWDDPAVAWERFDLVVLRSTWDYTARAAEFLAWTERCAAVTRLANPAQVVRWNADKRYLGELAAAGVPVVPTRYLAPGEDGVELPADHEFVLKPATSAGARLSARYRPEEREQALRHLARLHEEGYTALLQPFVRRIDSTGERALVHCAGTFSHAIRKGSVLEPGVRYDEQKNAHPGVSRWEPTEAELRVARQALAAVPGSPELLYARVDLVDGEDGEPQLMELELIEPQLFLTVDQDALSVFATAIRKSAESTR
ncbi:RimK family alpha-L-glutamate ligase [Kitasatospora sp. NPDC006697]|uniref:ATP-grasp domain-containing protein n=1 Tax=Kitasatospora sp. NPDC006697 TaxID=3364020 RepID=UPI0036CAF87E